MPAFLALAQGRLKQFTGWVTAAAAFQQTSLITLGFLLPVMPGRSLKVRLLRIGIMFLVALSLAQIFLLSRLQTFFDAYIISQQMQSEGAAIRVAMNALPAVIFLVRGRVLRLAHQELLVWQGMAWLAMACVIGLKLVPSTTVVDRIALYAIPLQLFVGSRIPDLKLFRFSSRWLTVGVVGLAGLVQFVWLVYAKTAFAWLPYKNVLF
jgi:hypothetical protein